MAERRGHGAAFITAALGLVALAACGTGGPGGTGPGRERCRAGETRACTITLDGGFVQDGTQSCDPSDRTWAACLGAGSCRGPSGAVLAAYGRCASEAECGPPGCAACNGYSGVQNPGGFRVCYPYCANDNDCAPSTASTDVSARCVLGQCILLCRASSTCPRDAQCLPWLDARAGEAYPGYAGLCD